MKLIILGIIFILSVNCHQQLFQQLEKEYELEKQKKLIESDSDSIFTEIRSTSKSKNYSKSGSNSHSKMKNHTKKSKSSIFRAIDNELSKNERLSATPVDTKLNEKNPKLNNDVVPSINEQLKNENQTKLTNTINQLEKNNNQNSLLNQGKSQTDIGNMQQHDQMPLNSNNNNLQNKLDLNGKNLNNQQLNGNDSFQINSQMNQSNQLKQNSNSLQDQQNQRNQNTNNQLQNGSKSLLNNQNNGTNLNNGLNTQNSSQTAMQHQPLIKPMRKCRITETKSGRKKRVCGNKAQKIINEELEKSKEKEPKNSEEKLNFLEKKIKSLNRKLNKLTSLKEKELSFIEKKTNKDLNIQSVMNKNSYSLSFIGDKVNDLIVEYNKLVEKNANPNVKYNTMRVEAGDIGNLAIFGDVLKLHKGLTLDLGENRYSIEDFNKSIQAMIRLRQKCGDNLSICEFSSKTQTESDKLFHKKNRNNIH